MFSALRRRLTYTNVGVTLALFFSMSGGALAAGHYLVTSTKQIKPSVLSALKGKAGSAGASGATGPAGGTGPAGAQGPQGSAGVKGETGAEGKEGKPGKEGKAGKEGSPWTAGGTLPPEKTETGTWSFGDTPIEASAELRFEVPISFNIPLAEGLESTHTHYVTRTEQETNTAPQECPGSIEKPSAEPGSLCVYELYIGFTNELDAIMVNPEKILAAAGAGTTGTVLRMKLTNKTLNLNGGHEPIAAEAYGFGAWAVTAPKEEK
jgi:hypothetical protein